MKPETFLRAQALWVDPTVQAYGVLRFNTLIGRVPTALLELYRSVYRTHHVAVDIKRAAFERMLDVPVTIETRRVLRGALLDVALVAYRNAEHCGDRGSTKRTQLEAAVEAALTANSISLLADRTRDTLLLLLCEGPQGHRGAFGIDYERDGPLIEEINLRLFEVLCEAAEGKSLEGLSARICAWQEELPAILKAKSIATQWAQALGRISRIRAAWPSGAAVSAPQFPGTVAQALQVPVAFLQDEEPL